MLHQREQLADLVEIIEILDLTGDLISLFIPDAVRCLTLQADK